MLSNLTLIAWFYFATVDHVQVWGFGPFSSREECMTHREMTIPVTAEATCYNLYKQLPLPMRRPRMRKERRGA